MATTQPFSRDSWARHYAANHYDIDEALVEIYHLPQNAPEREIRLLEVNRLIPEFRILDTVNFGMTQADGVVDPHSIVILDVTPSQWEAILRGELTLPEGWSLKGYQHIERPSPAGAVPVPQ